ncbi:MAG TPA: NUDIX domain-containing protein [Dongiaceae bacterium]|jgi:predicted NUDIX family NTP pyrophosphohydrolase
MAKQTAGLLLYRKRSGVLEVLLAHPGGPFWAKKDLGVWSIPKGEFLEDEAPLDAARREFNEEIGTQMDGDFLELTPRKQPGGKTVHAFAVEGDLDASSARSNLFEMEWPPKSGRMQSFPEVDRAEWFGIDEARERLLKGQLPILEELVEKIGAGSKHV